MVNVIRDSFENLIEFIESQDDNKPIDFYVSNSYAKKEYGCLLFQYAEKYKLDNFRCEYGSIIGEKDKEKYHIEFDINTHILVNSAINLIGSSKEIKTFGQLKKFWKTLKYYE